ncbi:DUF4175 domain-containing protein [Marivivens donghaensis]|uniref:DUF4175 domain-containing protein n=1 Tax=Marivivens donghaensis TaxID=1699413 RepID=UPI001FEC7DEC|nr:DUF4175 domain-containing protein [Marivivens donghaensis]
MRLPVLATRIGLLAERIVRSYWPVWTVAFFLLAPLMFGWQDFLPLEAFWAIIATGIVALAVTLYLGWRKFHFPTEAEAIARVDGALEGRPISALNDAQAIGSTDEASKAVWAVHLERMLHRTRDARPVSPDLRVSERDPFGVRYMALLFFLVAVMFGSVWRIGTVAEIAQNGTPTAAVMGPTWEGWIEPPAYTGMPTLYLPDLTTDRIEVLSGSKITVRFYGDIGDLTLAETVSARAGSDVPPASQQQQSFNVQQGGKIDITGQGGRSWDVTLLPDNAPSVRLDGEIEVDAKGVMTQPFHASDDYGVVGGTATFTLDMSRLDRHHGLLTDPDPHEPLIVDIPLPITGDRSDFDASLVEDFSEEPIANLPVVMQIAAEDAAGNVATSEPHEIILPGRRFFEPIAKSVIEMRRDLLWAKANAPRVTQILRALSAKPEELFTDMEPYVAIRDAIVTLENGIEAGLSDEVQNDVAAQLWAIAVDLEEGSLANALERLNRARERLNEAMRNGASPEEIQELMDELREATEAYTQMLADQAGAPEDQTDSPDQRQGNSMTFTQDEINALMDRIQELMSEGKMAEAQELMQQLNDLIDNMQVQQGQGQDGPRTQGERSMEELGDTLQEQQELSDDAFRDLQEQFNPGMTQDGEPQFGQEEDGGEQDEGQGEQSLADRQQALRNMLERQRHNLPALTGEEAEIMRRSLENADRAMDEAEQALRDNNMSEALDRQAEALDSLREGMRNLGQALTNNREREEGSGNDRAGATRGSDQQAQNTDPLGRQLGQSGRSDTDRGMLQDEDVYRRAGELLDEIRRRAGELNRSEDERSYLERLLDQF